MFEKTARFARLACVAIGICAAFVLQGADVRGGTMGDQEIRAALKRHWSMSGPNDPMGYEIYHDDVLLEFPQSGERFRGLANLRAFRQAYPARVTFAIRRHLGGGDTWVTELVVTYDGKKSINAVSIMEFREGKVARETLYFGDPFEAPAWRKQWVERME
jgi:hypothetical protein